MVHMFLTDCASVATFDPDALQFADMNEFAKRLVTTLDPHKQQFISFDQLVDGLRALGFEMSYAESFTILKKFDTKGDNRLDVRA